jgi:hypothetical protein
MKTLIVLTVPMLLSAPVLGDELAPFLYYEAGNGYVIEDSGAILTDE